MSIEIGTCTDYVVTYEIQQRAEGLSSSGSEHSGGHTAYRIKYLTPSNQLRRAVRQI